MITVGTNSLRYGDAMWNFDDESKRYVYEHIKLSAHREPKVQMVPHVGNGTATDGGYDPTIKILLRIMRVILENEPIIRTTLALKARVNYTILAKHLDWLERRGLVELFVDEGKISVRLSVEGVEFAYRLSGLWNNKES